MPASASATPAMASAKPMRSSAPGSAQTISAATVPASASTSGEYGPEIIGQPCHVSQGRAHQHTDREDEGAGRDEGGKARIQRHLAESSQQDEQSIEPQQ